MRFDDFPRPAADNGIGFHFGLDLRPAAVDTFVPRLVDLGSTWCLVAHSDESQLLRAAKAMSEAGTLPVSRWICHIDQNILDFTPFVRAFHSLGLPAYVQIFNEPTNPSEWRDNVCKPLAFVARWCDHAQRVADAGGYPGLQVLEPEGLKAVIHELRSRDAKSVLDRLWFCPHPYGANHPPAYPYDERNQYDHPGSTVASDDIGVLGFLRFVPTFEQELGFIPPFIAGEGGWQYGNSADGRYPIIGDDNHAEYHKAVFEWFREGRLANGEQLPDYLFAFCPWILFGEEADAWYSLTSGTRQQTIDAVKSIPRFVRKQSTSISSPPPAHYILFGTDGEGRQRHIAAAQDYVHRFNAAFGFSLLEASRARVVTLVGDHTIISPEDELQLVRAGCRVERLVGGEEALALILNDRLTRNSEFG